MFAANVRPMPGRVRVIVRNDLPRGNPACGRFGGEIVVPVADGPPVRTECVACGCAYVLDSQRPGGMCMVETGTLWDRLLEVQDAFWRGHRDAGVWAGARDGTTTVMRHARRLGLWREEWKDRPKPRLRKETLPDRLLERHRAGWLAFRASGVSAPVKGMPKAAFNAYRYLIRKDRGWLEKDHPLRRSVPVWGH